MFRRLSHFTIPLTLGIAATVATPSRAETAVTIARVAPEYRPTAGPEMPEAVSMRGFSFEVDPGTGRARIVVDYTYPDQAAFGMSGGAGPAPTVAQLPGLKYDAAARAVVYDDGGRRTVCATVRDRQVMLWKHLAVTPTGACVVSAHPEEHAEDTGWTIRRSHSIETIFEVR